ncbi:aminotransferase class V-fold PLP-dependent enzyme [Corynebacterium sp. Marseille-P8863]|uniref:aminotransferase class V-fold PLP-dependent enzyme n=1 Tax=Corynebacterium sp. Marseille-P8863 TaxID=2866576 RepID=UPI002264E719|nr:aminotransferase class V-fold PLP-dependent enzyme [Corynebacterium sp. Marseille-P8863]
MTQLPLPDIDADGLLEYSVVFTDRSLNHMSQKFISATQEMLTLLTSTYGADSAALVPGGGTAAMEAVARQLFTGKKVLILRSGLFTYRWSQIIESGQITDPDSVRVLNAQSTSQEPQPSFAPPALEEVRGIVEKHQPDVIVTAHTETAAGLTLPDDYIAGLGEIAKDNGALFVLDCIAAGASFPNMESQGIDVLVSAPQKSWSGSPSTGYVLLSPKGREAVLASESTSFTLDLKKWLGIFDGYRDGKAGYHSTLPTDTILHNLEIMRESAKVGLGVLAQNQETLGRLVREAAYERGFRSVAADGFESNGVVVLYANTPEQQSGAAFTPHGLQIASGVPLQIGEGDGFSTFRIGLFGLDKWADPQAAAQRFIDVLDAL